MFIISKNDILRVVCFIVVGIICTALGLANSEIVNVSSSGLQDKYKIIIDAGHGLPDGGAVSDTRNCRTRN